MELIRQAELLRNVPMFSKLDPARLKLLAFTSEQQTFEDGEEVFRAGEAADSAYVIMDGEVEILNETEDGTVVAGLLVKNELFGELAVLTNAERAATLRARGRLEALRISAESFIGVVTENPDVALHVMRQLSMKLVRTHRAYEALQARVERTRRGDGGSDPGAGGPS